MKRKVKKIVVFLLFLLVLSVGCKIFDKGDESSGVTTPGGTTSGSGTTSERNMVDQILEADEFFQLAMSDMFDEAEDALDLSSQNIGLRLSPSLAAAASDTTMPTAALPVGWRRKRTGLTSINKNYEFGETDTTKTCTVTITRDVTAELHVDTTDDGRRNPGKKDIADTISYKFYLEKNLWSAGWRIVKISPREMKLTDTSKQIVFIDRLQVINSNGETVFDVTAPDQMLSREELPKFTSGEQVKVMVTVRNTSPTYYPECFVFLHRFIGPWQIQRLQMFDDGSSGGDEVADDGVFTNTWTIRGPERQHAAVDVLDSKCLQNETEDDYNSNAWGIPYRVR